MFELWVGNLIRTLDLGIYVRIPGPENCVRTVGSGNSMFEPWFKELCVRTRLGLYVRTLASGNSMFLCSNPSGNCMFESRFEQEFRTPG